MEGKYKTEIPLLLKRVEHKYAKPLATTSDFDAFSNHLNQEYRILLSPSTLKRLWGYVNYFHKPRTTTLDLLANYVGYDHFYEFVKLMENEKGKNKEILFSNLIEVMNEGECFEVTWNPNCYLLLQYQGNYTCRVIETRNTMLKPGDLFMITETDLKRENDLGVKASLKSLPE